jgi:cell wall-associated NlpC family hydrolase
LEVLPYRPLFGTARNGHRVIAFTRAPRRIALVVAAIVGLMGLAPAAASPPTVGTPSSTTPSSIPSTATADRSHPVFAPDGCPTAPPENTLRGLPAVDPPSLYRICTDSVADARSPQAARAIRFALAEIGTPYSQPLRNEPHIYDCSSFVSRAYQAAGVPIAYPDTPDRVDGGKGQNTPGSRNEVSAPWAVPVTPETAKPGDLVFFDGADPPFGHVGILLAGGLMVHTNKTGDVAHVEPVRIATVTAWRAVDPEKVVTTPDADAQARTLAAQALRDRYETAARDAARIARDLKSAQADRTRANKDLLAAQHAQTKATRRRDKARTRLQQVAVDAYLHGGMSDNAELLLSVTSVTDLGRRQALLKAVGTHNAQLIEVYEQARDAAAREEHNLRNRVAALDARIAALTAAAAEAQRTLVAARTDPASPILGSSQFDAAQLAAWFASTGAQARTSVPIDALAKLFIAEGARAGVRGDVAFAEAALDSGNFTFPETGPLSGNDNGLSLIGGCDTCRAVPWFTSAAQAVRAQMQLLRTYADPGVTPSRLGAPPEIPAMLDAHAKGTITTWDRLPGMAVPAPDYGTLIMQQYNAIASWVDAHPTSN